MSERREPAVSGIVFGRGDGGGGRDDETPVNASSGFGWATMAPMTKPAREGASERHGRASHDDVHEPAHYAGDGTVTCKVAMRSMMHGIVMRGDAAFWWGCAFKYLWRWPRKHARPAGKLQDIDKAIECLRALREEVTRANEVDPGA